MIYQKIFTFFKQCIAFEYMWLFILLVCGSIMVFSMPPFQVMDEYKHFYKSYSIAQGNILCTDNEDGVPGFYVPEHIRDAGIIMGVQDTEYRYDEKVTREEIERASRTDTASGNSVFVEHPFCESPVWSSVPQAIGIKIGQIFSMSLLDTFYTGRLVSFLMTVGVLFVAMRILPFGKAILAFVTLLPMFLQQIASYSLDGMHYALLFVFFAYLLSLSQREEPYTNKTLISLALFSIFAVYAKFGFMPLVFLIYILPYKNFGSAKKYWLYTTGLVLLHVIVFFVLRTIFTAGDIVNAGLINRDEQFAWIIAHPFAYIGVLLNTLDVHFFFYLKNLLGILGWLDYGLYGAHYMVLLGMMCFLLAGQEKDVSVRLGTMQRWLIIIVATVNAVLLITILYAMDDPVAYPIVSLMQGKYFLPLLPLLFFALYQLRITTKTRNILVLFVMAGTFPAVMMVQQSRYYDTRLEDVVPYIESAVQVEQVTAQKIFRQQFTARANSLQSIAFWIANKDRKAESSVRLLLKDADCQEVISSHYLRENEMTLNGYYTFRFPKIEQSKDQQYCFQFHPTLENPKVPLEVAVSSSDRYKDGRASIDHVALPGDLIMKLGYEEL